jgi:protein-tyrosine phosphatase
LNSPRTVRRWLLMHPVYAGIVHIRAGGGGGSEMRVRKSIVVAAATAAVMSGVGAPAWASTAAPVGVTAVSAVELVGVKNFRDVGGYATADGPTVRTGVVYRSNKLSELTDADVQRLV